MTNQDNTTNTKKTFFFRETITIASKGIVADTFEEAQEQYLDMFAANVKFGKMDLADETEFNCYSVDEKGNEVREY